MLPRASVATDSAWSNWPCPVPREPQHLRKRPSRSNFPIRAFPPPPAPTMLPPPSHATSVPSSKLSRAPDNGASCVRGRAGARHTNECAGGGAAVRAGNKTACALTEPPPPPEGQYQSLPTFPPFKGIPRRFPPPPSRDLAHQQFILV